MRGREDPADGTPPSKAPMRIHLGCTGWAYPDWVGPFYAPGTAPADFLASYARVFRAVEVDSTYYRAPTRDLVERWARVTPPGFTFAVKVPGEVTHERRLFDVAGPLSSFLAALAPLAAARKLGPILAVLPPSFGNTPDHAARLDAFLGAFPRDVRVAVELRHASWFVPATRATLERRRAALVWSVNEHAAVPTWVTTDFLYGRLVGDRELTVFDRIQLDKRDEIEAWRKAVAAVANEVAESFLLVNNHYMGFAPGTARIVAEAFGTTLPDLAAAKRPTGQAALGSFET